jgi:outer membrane receptor protein involved in Fe transport
MTRTLSRRGTTRAIGRPSRRLPGPCLQLWRDRDRSANDWTATTRPSVASGYSVFDFGLAKQLSRQVEFNFGLDNLTNRDYYETQNYFESRVTPDAPVVARIPARQDFG